jgi:hypothetical protein
MLALLHPVQPRRLLRPRDGAGTAFSTSGTRVQGFVADGWTYESRFEHFVQEMRRRSLLIWATSEHGGEWTVTTEAPSHAGRSVTGNIVSTMGRLCITNYESLIMAAQSADVSLPEPHMADLLFDVEVGTLQCSVSRLHGDDSAPEPHFAISLSPAGALGEPWVRPAWYEPTDT